MGLLCAAGCTAGSATQSEIQISRPVDRRGASDGGRSTDASELADAGTQGDGGASDTNDDGGTSSELSICDLRPGALFCDDFESGDFSAWDSPEGMSIERVDVCRGTYSARASLGSGTAARVQGVLDRPIVANGSTFYGRANFYVPAGPAIEHLDFFAMAESDSRGRDDPSIMFTGIRGDTQIYFQDVQSDGDSRTAGLQMPRDRYFCLEWKVTLGTPGNVWVKLDGVLKSDGDADTPLNNGGIDRVIVPIHFADRSVQAPIDVLVDDVIIDTSPIPCELPVTSGVACRPLSDG